MRASRTTRSGHAIAALWRLPLSPPLASLTLLASLTRLACASPAVVDAPPIPEAASLSPGALRVRLAFGPEADLDLYVTGPSQETVYFANTPSREGGELAFDRRCDDPAPRIESVVFPDAEPGLYRVGVDFMVRCDGAADEAAYRLVFEPPGGEPLPYEGVARFGVFEPRVLEHRVDP
jgi:hypothetical protein